MSNSDEARPTAVEPEARPCVYCGGRRWTEDENWSPDDPATWKGERSHGNGLIPCGGCNEGGWTTPDWERPTVLDAVTDAGFVLTFYDDGGSDALNVEAYARAVIAEVERRRLAIEPDGLPLDVPGDKEIEAFAKAIKGWCEIAGSHYVYPRHAAGILKAAAEHGIRLARLNPTPVPPEAQE